MSISRDSPKHKRSQEELRVAIENSRRPILDQLVSTVDMYSDSAELYVSKMCEHIQQSPNFNPDWDHDITYFN